MSETRQFIDLDPKDYKLNDYDNVRITMPAKPEMTEEDIDAQLFEYVISGGKQINSIADLDDEWVQNQFGGTYETIEDVRLAIKEQYDHDMEFSYADIKYHACCDALIARLEGDIPEDVLEENIETVRQANEQRLTEMHISLQQYLKEEHLTPDQYEDKLRDETLYQMKLNVCMDIMCMVLNVEIGNHEITEYLSTPDPAKFLEEIRENGQVENARRAAARVRAMRRVIDMAWVQYEGSDAEAVVESAQPAVQPVKPAVEKEDDIEAEHFVLPDFDNLPAPKIQNDAEHQGGPKIIGFEPMKKKD